MVTYRLATETDYNNINHFYNRIYKKNRTIDQFYWEFHNCPDGKSIYVIAEDEGKVVGTNCVIPIHLITADNKIIKSGKSEDTLVDPDYRGQKIFENIYDFLFKKCQEHGIQVIWGFTSAKKPFKKLGFSIPFDHLQSLIVNDVWKSYKYLASLNKKNTFINKLKIFGLCVFSKIKTFGLSQAKLTKYTIKVDEKIVEGIEHLIKSNLSSLDQSFCIYQNKLFQDWRIYQNPNYYKIHSYGFYDSNDNLIALIILNSHTNGVAYFCQSTFHQQLDLSEKNKILKFVVAKMFKSGICLIRNWHFNTNILNKHEIDVFKAAKFVILNRGISFVWKELDQITINPSKFYLSRISTQGAI